jgi:hypothetical protein
MSGRYDQTVDRDSAFEQLRARTEGRQPVTAAPQTSPLPDTLSSILFGRTGPRGGHHDGLIQSAARSAARTMGSSVGRQIMRGVLGSLFGGKR